MGTFLLFLRIFLFLLFIIGICRSLTKTKGKLKGFLINFAKMGSIYLLSWPIAVICSEIFLPNYMHKEVISFVEEIAHLMATGLICGIYTYPDSSYRKVNLKDNDEILPSFSK